MLRIVAGGFPLIMEQTVREVARIFPVLAVILLTVILCVSLGLDGSRVLISSERSPSDMGVSIVMGVPQ